MTSVAEVIVERERHLPRPWVAARMMRQPHN
jgi:hypothetical protein